jgi:glycosyltransferase involved in cell wall biosynthesis
LKEDSRLAASGSRLAAPNSQLDPANPTSQAPVPDRESRRPRVAIIHDWLTGMRGGEKVLEAICELYPGATIYTLVQVRGSVAARIEQHRIRHSPIQRLPWSGQRYREYLPLFPAMVELFDLDGYDLVISSSHCAVKSVIRSPTATHVCYCHSPMRYAWDQFSAYFGPDQVGPWRSRLLRPVMAGLARWDAATAGRVDRFLANSQYVAGRIRRYYNRGSTVVYPPVDTTFYRLPEPLWRRQPESSFLIVSALVPYKRVDLAIDACHQIGMPLKIVGRGPEEARLRGLAGPDVEFLGWRTDDEVRDLYWHARAVLLPGTEDFGMVPVEALACGTPVVALGAGGACETVIDGVTGVLVGENSADAFAAGLSRLRRLPLDPATIRANAERFSRARFLTDFHAAVSETVRARSTECQDAGAPSAATIGQDPDGLSTKANASGEAAR